MRRRNKYIKPIIKLSKRIKIRTWIALGVLVVLSPIVFFTLFWPGGAQADWANDNWHYRKRLTIDHTLVSGTTNLTNFPVQVTITDDTSIGDAAQNDGDDLLFTDINGNTLDYELESYSVDGSGADLVAWVRVPSLQATEDMSIYLYYGNPSATTQEKPNAVWDSNFTLVQHLQETSGVHNDSAGYSNNSDALSVVNQGATVGVANGSDEFDGTTSYIHLPEESSGDLEPSGDMTISFWTKLDTLATARAETIDFLRKAYSTSPFNAYYVTIENGTDDILFGWRNTTPTGYIAKNNTALSTGTWYHIVAVKTASAMTIYVNGTNSATYQTPTPTGTLLNTDSGLYIGANTPTQENVDGVMDEFRISKAARSSDWIVTEYNNTSSPSTFVTVGTEEASPGPVAYYKFDEGVDNTCSGGTNDACDSTSNKHDLLNSDGVWQNEDLCFNGKCLFFDNTVGPHLTATDDSDFNFTATQSFTVSAWFRHSTDLSTFNDDVIISKYGSTGGYKLAFMMDGTLRCGIDDDSSYTPDAYVETTDTYNDNLWHYVSCVKNSNSSLSIYVDGNLIATNSSISGVGSLTNTSSFSVGSDNTVGISYDGSLDEVKVYRYARSADEIKVDYAGGAAILGKNDQSAYLTDGLAGYWKMDETSWTNDCATTSVLDASGNNNNGKSCPNTSGPTGGAAGKFANSGAFDGINDTVVTDSSVSLSPTSGVTVAGWIKMDDGFSSSTNTNYSVVDKGDYQFYLDSSDGKAHWVVNDSAAKAFEALGAGVNGTVNSLGVWNNELYIGGGFTDAGGDPDADRIAKWDGSSFSWPTGQAPNNTIYAFAVWNNEFYVGGTFTDAGGDTDADRIAKWDGSSFSWPTGQGLTGTVNSLGVWNNELYVGGSFYNAGGDPDADYLAKWDGSSFSWPTGQGLNSSSTHSMVVWNNELYVGGGFTDAGGDPDADYIAKWDGSSFSWPTGQGLNSFVRNIVIWNNELYMSGEFLDAGGDTDADRIAKWDGSSFSWPTGQGLNSWAYGLTVWNNELYVAGGFTDAGGDTDADRIAKWDGSSFSWPTGQGLNSYIWDLIVWNNELYIGGNFTSAGGNINANRIAGYGTAPQKSVIGTTGSWLADTWYHVAGTFNGRDLEVFVNGESQGKTSNLDSFSLNANSLSSLYLGSAHGLYTQGSLKGSLDETRIYNHALTPAEIKSLYKWAPEPVAYYNFEETEQTTTLYDRAGNTSAYNGTLTSVTSTSWVPGKYGSGLRLDGSADFVDFSSGPDSISTVSFWVYPQTTTEYFMNLTSSSDYIWLNGGTVTLNNITGTVYINGTQSTSMNAGEWQFVTVVISSAETGANLEIGRTSTGSYLEGIVDEVRIYNYARTVQQINEDMNARHPTGGSPVGSQTVRLKFDEGYGDTANTSAGSSYGNLAGANSCPGNGACPTWTTSGKYDHALTFDGGDYLTLSSVAPVQTSSKTIAFWAKPNGAISGNQTMFSLGALNYYVGFADTNQPQVSYVNASAGNEYWDTDLNLAVPNEWHHYTFVFDVNGSNVDLYFYLDGILRDTRSDPDGMSATYGSTGYIGSYDGTTGFYSGDLDELQFYDSALNVNQIALVMNNNSSVAYSPNSSEAASFSDGAGNSPIGYWSLDENTDDTCSGGSNDVCDKSGNANDGANNNGPAWKPGKYGASLNYDGGGTADDYTEIGDDSIIQDIFDSGGTVEAWINPKSDGESDSGVIAMKTTWQTYLTDQSGSNVRFRFWKGFDGGSDGNWTTPVNIPVNTWTHVAVTYNSSSTSNDPVIYVNGLAVAISEGETPTGTRISDLGYNLFLGNYNTSIRTFDGRIDEVKLYDYIRTPAQIAYDFNRGLPIAWWKMDECTDTNVYDSSGNGIEGIVYANAGTYTAAGTCASGLSTHMRYMGRSGKLDSSLDFDGSDDFVSMGDDSLLDFADGADLSITGWFYRDTATTDDTIVAKRNGIVDTDDGYILYLDDATDKLIFEMSDSGDADEYQMESSSTFTNTGWYFFAVVWDESSAANSRIYINSIDDNETHTGTIANMGSVANSLDFYLGAESDGGSPFDGKLDDIRIYSYTLSQDQVKSIQIGGASARYGPTTGRP